MSSNDPEPNKPLFRTPNPTELKEAAKEDPIHDRDSAQESDTKQDDTEVERLGVADMLNSQVIRANTSGH
jgi:hypothetical protein